MSKSQVQRHVEVLAPSIDAIINPEGGRRLGFLLMVYEHKPGDELAYVSNSERLDLRAALLELVEKLPDGRVVALGRTPE